MSLLKQSQGRRAPSGFALVTTLTLMVVIMVLAVSLLTLSSSTLRHTSINRNQEMAMANARMGLMLALGRLQEMTGDDRRVTATAGVSLDPSLEHASRHWTGVWSNADPAEDIYTKTPEARFEGWLVSGNPTDLINPDSAAIPMTDQVTMVGPGSAGIQTAGHVSVPLMSVSSPVGGHAGRYAWWIGDEGVKARGNLADFSDPTAPVDALALNARGAGWELSTGLEDFPDRESTELTTLARVHTMPTLPLAFPTLSAGLPQYFHDMSMDARSLLTDTLHGGMRTDLSPYLADGFPATADDDTLPNPPQAGENIVPDSVFPDILGPKWDRLHAFAEMKPDSGNPLMVQVGDGAGVPHVTPMIFDLRILYGAKAIGIPSTLPGEDPETTYIHPCAKISVVIANPYPHPLRWTDELELELERTGGTGTSCIWIGNRPQYFKNGSNDTPSVFGDLVFTIAPGELPPGEARAYTLQSPVNRPDDAPPVRAALEPFLSNDPTDFNNSVILEDDHVYTFHPRFQQITMEVLEFGNSVLVGAELRQAGASGGVLQSLQSFELNNGASGPEVRRRLRRSEAPAMTDPFPLMLYSFQLSQPGMDYASLMPPVQFGARNSTVRTFMDFNPRAQHFNKPIVSYTVPPFFFEMSDNKASLPFTPPGGDCGLAFTRNLALPQPRWGFSSSSGPQRTILYAQPDQIVSMAQFQHADLTANDRRESVSIQSGHAFGNSYASMFVRRDLSHQERYDYKIRGHSRTPDSESNRYYDMSYMLNAALWDSFFVSTVPREDTTDPLNTRYAKMEGDLSDEELRDPLTAASGLWIEGGFNVNSTSKEAWRAVLTAGRKLSHPSESSAPDEGVMFPRSFSQPGQALSPAPSGDGNDSYHGFRRITDEQIDALAEEIVRQVRLRGPFVSLSHFVNRSLVELTDDDDHLGRSGALQSAIDESGLNMVPGQTTSGFANILPENDRLYMQATDDGAPLADLVLPGQSFGTRATHALVTNAPGDTGPPVWASRSRDGNPSNCAAMFADREMLTDPALAPEQGFRSTGIPSWLTQADVLQAIGPVITARSDTFRIRSYGESLDSSGKVVAKAWCEAVVQRLPDYVDTSDDAQTRRSDLNPTNAKFNRRYAVMSFRWLHPDEV